MDEAQAFAFVISSQDVNVAVLGNHISKTTAVDNSVRDHHPRIGQSASLRDLKFGAKSHKD